MNLESPIEIIENLIQAEQGTKEKLESWFVCGDSWHMEKLRPAVEKLCDYCGEYPDKLYEAPSCYCRHERLFGFLKKKQNPRSLRCREVRKVFGLQY